MNGAAAKAAYARRMHRVLEHIDQHVDQSLDLATLAAVANFSPFHFHRLFTAYLRHVGPCGDAVAAFWQQQFQPYMARHGLLGRPICGISHDDPHITEPAKCRYDAGVKVDAQHVAGHGALLTQIPGGRYASLPFRGTPATIGAA